MFDRKKGECAPYTTSRHLVEKNTCKTIIAVCFQVGLMLREQSSSLTAWGRVSRSWLQLHWDYADMAVFTGGRRTKKPVGRVRFTPYRRRRPRQRNREINEVSKGQSRRGGVTSGGKVKTCRLWARRGKGVDGRATWCQQRELTLADGLSSMSHRQSYGWGGGGGYHRSTHLSGRVTACEGGHYQE